MKHGLLSTEALLDQIGADAEDRRSILSEHRSQQVIHRGFRIRDQKPMPYGKLKNVLEPAGIQPRQWFEFLNRKVFFWTSPGRLDIFRSAYKSGRQLIIEVPTECMVAAHRDEISLCHINAGAVRMPNHYRSFETFRPISSFPYSAKKKHIELTVAYAVKDIHDLACKVSEVGNAEPEVLLYSN